MTTEFHQEELVRIGRSATMLKVLDHIGDEAAQRAKQKARVRTGRMRQDIGHSVGTDAYGSYVDVYTSASRRGFRYGAYWNAIDHYLDAALRG